MSNTTRALLWSKRQNCFHIEPMSQLMHKNLTAFVHEKSLNDYHLIGFGTDEEVRQMADRLRPTLHERDERNQVTHHQPT